MNTILDINERPNTPQGFDPGANMAPEPAWTGRRKQIQPAAESVAWRWPEERKAQYEAFDDWHDIAMQVIHRAGKSFRLMAVYKKVIRWSEGCVWSSDEELAVAAGHCYWKTISRDVATHRKLGIILVEHGWRVVAGKKVRTRTIRPAIPSILDPEINVRDLTNHTVTRGPDVEGNHTVTRWPNHTVTRGPITIDTIEEGDSRDVTA